MSRRKIHRQHQQPQRVRPLVPWDIADRCPHLAGLSPRALVAERCVIVPELHAASCGTCSPALLMLALGHYDQALGHTAHVCDFCGSTVACANAKAVWSSVGAARLVLMLCDACIEQREIRRRVS